MNKKSKSLFCQHCYGNNVHYCHLLSISVFFCLAYVYINVYSMSRFLFLFQILFLLLGLYGTILPWYYNIQCFVHENQNVEWMKIETWMHGFYNFFSVDIYATSASIALWNLVKNQFYATILIVMACSVKKNEKWGICGIMCVVLELIVFLVCSVGISVAAAFPFYCAYDSASWFIPQKKVFITSTLFNLMIMVGSGYLVALCVKSFVIPFLPVILTADISTFFALAISTCAGGSLMHDAIGVSLSLAAFLLLHFSAYQGKTSLTILLFLFPLTVVLLSTGSVVPCLYIAGLSILSF